MRKIFSTFMCLAIFTIFTLLIPGMASAKSIFEYQNMTIPAGQTVENVYVIGGDADVWGQVTGTVVVINGSLNLGRTAAVKGAVVVIGGRVNQDPGAVLGDDVYGFSLNSATQNSLLIGAALTVGLWMLQLAGSLFMIIIPLLISAAGKSKIAAFSERYLRESMGRILFTGVLIGLIITAVSALLLVTVIGIPILIVILLAAVAAFALGTAAISYRIGEMLQGSAQRSDWMKVLTGAAILTAFANIPIAGWVVLLLITLISFGICTQWLAGKRRKGTRATTTGE